MRHDRFFDISQAIRKTPHLFYQGDWGDPDTAIHTCETPGCTAGWTVALFGDEETLEQYRIQSGYFGAIHTYATELLELTDEESETLFNARWPHYFLNEPERDEVFTELENRGIHTLTFNPTSDQAANILEQIGNGELSILELEDA